MTPSAVVLVGDHPAWPTGLARILRDVGGLLTRALPNIPRYCASYGPTSYIAAGSFGFVPVTLHRGDDWGAEELQQWWMEEIGERRGLLFTLYDPVRCVSLVTRVPAAASWGYFAIDAENLNGRLTGLTEHSLRQYTRRLAYTRWAAGLITRTLGSPCDYLPHGLDLNVFRPAVPMAQHQRFLGDLGDAISPETILVGCVTANQPRKDLGLWALTIRRLMARYGQRLYAWLHTDSLVKSDSPSWSIPQLLKDVGIADRVLISTSLTDEELAARYACSTVTLAPGLGEGFGYPIVESLACGTPVIHHMYGGGTELVPRVEWKAPVRTTRLDGLHILVRPVVEPEDFANAAARAIDRMLEEGPTIRALCRLSVRHLGWDVLGERWFSWIQEGVV